ncbi:hypothetical protein [Flavobacterium geliluteum]|uniref:Lipoprotein n=1 Tax=Flavobacterium geliluteum TaxID=2816120 RepID=A0A940X7U6_9FLAO|nr:hypothetical protein [Flavobacterium geliluteum]MBP4138499.1 hypothetical protein [Flavobacterium geliluteum]
MMKKLSRIVFAIALLLLLTSCKNTKQKLQEYVTTYNSQAGNFKEENVKLTTARGYINDDKIELRFETDLEQNEVNKETSNVVFPKLLMKMIKNDQISKELITEGVRFDVYFLANDNTVLAKKIINKEELNALLK